MIKKNTSSAGQAGQGKSGESLRTNKQTTTNNQANIEPIQISCWTGKNLEIWRSVITTLSDIRTTTSCSLLMSGTNSRKTAWVFGKYFPRNLQWEFFSRQTKAFALFVRLLGSKTEQDAAECLPEQKPEVGFRLSFKGSHSPRKFTFFCC